MNNQSLEEDIKSISAQWQNYRDFCKTKSKTGSIVRSVNKNHEVYDLVTNQLREKIKKIVNSDRYTVDASIGLGLLSAIPWVAIFDKTITQSASEGFYIVILFSRSAQKIFLNLSLGSQQFEKLHGRDNKCLETIRLTTNKFREMFNEYAPLGSSVNIDLIEDEYKGEESLKSSSRWLAKSYELGTGFSKSYNISDLRESNLENDLEEFLSSYENIINDPQSISIDILSEKFSEKLIEENFSYELKPFSPKVAKNNNKIKSSARNKNTGRRKSNESHKTGRAGEDYVYEYEKNKLIIGNLPNLANQIQKHYEKGEYPGWDITSYDLDGNKIFIEVKSTKGKEINDFDITSNEWAAAQKEREKYYVYLVTKALSKERKISEYINDPYSLVEKKLILLKNATFNLNLKQ